MIEAVPGRANNDKFNEQLTYVNEMSQLYYRGDGPAMLLITQKPSSNPSLTPNTP